MLARVARGRHSYAFSPLLSSHARVPAELAAAEAEEQAASSSIAEGDEGRQGPPADEEGAPPEGHSDHEQDSEAELAWEDLEEEEEEEEKVAPTAPVCDSVCVIVCDSVCV